MEIFVCEEHIEKALDRIVDEYETFPVMDKVDNSIGLSTSCEYCQKGIVYMVGNVGSSTK